MSSSKPTGIVYTGNKMGPNGGGIYLKAGLSGGAMHCFIVTRFKRKKRSKLFNIDGIIY